MKVKHDIFKTRFIEGGIVAIVIVLIGCAGIGLNISDNGLTVLQKTATSTVGYLIAKNNPKYIDDMISWYNFYQTVAELNEAQFAFQDGMSKLSALVTGDLYLQLQIKNAMDILEINIGGPQTEIDLNKYKEIVDSFMAGVYAVNH